MNTEGRHSSRNPVESYRCLEPIASPHSSIVISLDYKKIYGFSSKPRRNRNKVKRYISTISISAFRILFSSNIIAFQLEKPISYRIERMHAYACSRFILYLLKKQAVEIYHSCVRRCFSSGLWCAWEFFRFVSLFSDRSTTVTCNLPRKNTLYKNFQQNKYSKLIK